MKIFLKSFVIAGAVLIFAAVICISYIGSSRKAATAFGSAGNGYLPSEDENFLLLAVGCGSKKDGPFAVSLINFAATEARVPIVTFSCDMRLFSGGGAETVSEIYRVGGMKKLKLAIRETFGVTPDRYIFYDRKSFEEFTGGFGETVLFCKSAEMLGGVPLCAGENSLSAEKLFSVMYAKNKDENERMLCVSRVLGAVIDAHLGEAVFTEEKAFRDLSETVKWDFSYRDAERFGDALAFIAKTKKKPTVILRPATVGMSDGTLCLIEESAEYIRAFMSGGGRQSELF